MTASPSIQAFFDGACPICSREVAYARRRDPNLRVQWVDIAHPGFDAAAYGLDARKVNEALHVRTPDGRVYTGVDAAIQVMRVLHRSFIAKLLLGILKIPGMMFIARIYYRWFARNRYRLTGRCTPESCSIAPPK